MSTFLSRAAAIACAACTLLPRPAVGQSLTGRLSALLTEQQATSVFVPDVPASAK